MAMSLAKTASVVDELGLVFAVEEDEEFARNIVCTKSEIDYICDCKEKQIQAIIHDLMNAVRKLQEETHVSPELQYLEQLKCIESEKSNLQKEIEVIEQNLKVSGEKLSEVLLEDSELEKLRIQESKHATLEIPHIKHLINLYSCITNINWDYNEEEDVCGYIVMNRNKNIKPFKFSVVEGRTPADIANSLWDLMWEDQVEREPSTHDSEDD